MSKVITIDTATVHRRFNDSGYTNEELCCILTGLVSIWRCNEHIPDITREAVMSELEEDDLNAAFLWNNVGIDLVEVGERVRALSLQHLIVRWSVVPFAIMLEYEDGHKTS